MSFDRNEQIDCHKVASDPLSLCIDTIHVYIYIFLYIMQAMERAKDNLEN